ncbi:histone-like nucleoid-structuring protein Lsr2 [Actinomyces oricola]|uniref:histone-like nucleoid-structuring protein Lsr2 n=1 Tax=Actinomyces oricola TaxID=206043 RepID=UPI000FFF2C0D|nr:Lsr2 family protein [Actinomyces oricola]
MAQKTQVILVDDVDGSEATQTVTFALDGVNYEIDLNDGHAAALRESFEEWTVKARRKSGRRNTGRRRASSASSGETQRIREWARAAGMSVSDRGRISADIREAYAQAHAN